jgi:hypothetical protein
MKKPVPGVLSGMVFLLTRTTRTRQRWRDGEGAFVLCLRRDVAAISKMHFCCKQYGAADRAAKGEGGDESSAPFCCPSPEVMDVDLDLCGGIYPKGARHNGLLCGRKPNSGASSNAHKTPLCWMPPHTTTGAADNAMPERCEGAARSGYHCTSSLQTASA